MSASINILYVEDNPGDVILMKEALKESTMLYQMDVLTDGVEAIAYLNREIPYTDAPTPHLLILDLQLPKKTGHEVLEEIKNDPALWAIPVVVLSSVGDRESVLKSYGLHANCCVKKPSDIEEYSILARAIAGFWCTVAILPGHEIS